MSTTDKKRTFSEVTTDDVSPPLTQVEIPFPEVATDDVSPGHKSKLPTSPYSQSFIFESNCAGLSDRERIDGLIREIEASHTSRVDNGNPYLPFQRLPTYPGTLVFESNCTGLNDREVIHGLRNEVQNFQRSSWYWEEKLEDNDKCMALVLEKQAAIMRGLFGKVAK
jgi:hypothetical protein